MNHFKVSTVYFSTESFGKTPHSKKWMLRDSFGFFHEFGDPEEPLQRFA
jgi:hypothetical protein